MRLDLILTMRYIYISFNLNPLMAFTSSSRSTKFKDIFKLGTSAAASEYCEWVQIEIDVYIPLKLKVISYLMKWGILF